ncbi:DUF1403 family protein [Microvirga sp. M2]|uniref:DUF1403 family protein n=1 Tax=Microvirga sp. M2 TaxID=3073270 RepID=UPI0039C46001
MPGPAEAAFAAGAALALLDQLVRRDPPELGAWRMRQALAAATACAAWLRLRTDLAGLRDAEHLTRAGDDPGPAGRLHRAWRQLAAEPLRDPLTVPARLAPLLGIATGLVAPVGGPAREDTDHPVAAAAAAAALTLRSVPVPTPEIEILAWMVADATLAHRLGWSAPVPLLATALLHASLRQGSERRRPQPGTSGWLTACHAAYARAAADAHGRAQDLLRRGERLRAALPAARFRGRDRGLALFLADDAVAPPRLVGTGSDRAARRFCDRLVALGAVRELTGRPTFRLYGL